jgi:hypothetical protein
VGALMVCLFAFQLFFRYQYMQANGVTWRIDRLTQQTCKVDIGQARCEPGASVTVIKRSVSTSTSTSTSTSVSLKAAASKPKH